MVSSACLLHDGAKHACSPVSSRVLAPKLRPAKVLSVGDDPVLLRTRHLVLQSAGYDVLSITSAASLTVEVLRSFDLVVLCHTLHDSGSLLLKSIQRTHPLSTLTLAGNENAPALCGKALTPLATPQVLLRTVRQMLAAQTP